MIKEKKILPNNKKLIIKKFTKISIPKTKYKRYTNKINNKRKTKLTINIYQNTVSSVLDNSKQELINTIKNFITDTNEESYNSISKYNTSPNHRSVLKKNIQSLLNKSQKKEYIKNIMNKNINDDYHNKKQLLLKK